MLQSCRKTHSRPSGCPVLVFVISQVFLFHRSQVTQYTSLDFHQTLREYQNEEGA